MGSIADISIAGGTLAHASWLVSLLAYCGTYFHNAKNIQQQSGKQLSRAISKTSLASLPWNQEQSIRPLMSSDLSGTFFNLGLALAVGLTLLAFSWTQFDEVIDVSQYLEDLEEDIEIEPPRTAEPPPPPPPPPPPVIEEVPEEELIEEEEPEFVDMSIDEEKPLSVLIRLRMHHRHLLHHHRHHQNLR